MSNQNADKDNAKWVNKGSPVDVKKAAKMNGHRNGNQSDKKGGK